MGEMIHVRVSGMDMCADPQNALASVAFACEEFVALLLALDHVPCMIQVFIYGIQGAKLPLLLDIRSRRSAHAPAMRGVRSV